MPLVLTLQEGSSFQAGSKLVTVVKVCEGSRLFVQVEGQDRQYEVTDRRTTEVLPEVRLSAGKPVNFGVIRVSVDAPRHIRIIRTPKASNTLGKPRHAHRH